MNHIKNSLPPIISVTICAIALLAIANKETLTFDIYWHLATGRDFLNLGDSPFFDHFTFTQFGETIKGAPVIFQIISAGFTSVFGFDNGIILLRICVYTCFLIALYYFYKTNRIHVFAIFATLPYIVFFLIQRGAHIRPELFSYVFLIVTLILYFNAIRDFNSKNLTIICLFLIFWGNYHTPVIGYIIITGLFFEKGIYKLKKQESFSWIIYLSWAMMIFLTGYINRDFNHFLFSQMNFSADWKYFIAEYASLSRSYSTTFRTVFFSSSILLAIWLFVKQKYGMLFITVLVVSQTWNITRLLSYSGILISSFYSILLSTLIQKQISRINTESRSTAIKQTVFNLTLLISITGHVYLIYTTYLSYHKKSNSEFFFPTGVVNYLKQNHTSGNIYNSYHFGGYLAYYLPRDFKTYIDGRTNILFPIDFYKTYLHSQHSPSILKNKVEEYNINLAILENAPSRYELIANTGIFSIEYVDQYFFLAKTGAANFPISGKILMKPGCWEYEITPALIKEFEKGKQILPTFSPLRDALDKIKEYSKSNDKLHFFQRQIDNDDIHDHTKRVLAYLALKQGFVDKSILLFKNIKNNISTDTMAIVVALIKQDEYKDAYKIVKSNFLPISNLKRLTISEREMILTLIISLSKKEGVVIDEQVLKDLGEIDPVENDALEKNLCTIRILPTNAVLISSEYIENLLSQEDE